MAISSFESHCSHTNSVSFIFVAPFLVSLSYETFISESRSFWGVLSSNQSCFEDRDTRARLLDGESLFSSPSAGLKSSVYNRTFLTASVAMHERSTPQRVLVFMPMKIP